MFKWPWKEKEKTPLEQERDRILKEMKNCDPATETYQTLTRRLTELSQIDAEYKKGEKKEKLSPNAIASGVIGLIEIVVIMTYEKGHVLATKAFGRIMRGRV